MPNYRDAQELPMNGKFAGMIDGDARVKSGSDVIVGGMIGGNLYIEAGSKVLVKGMVAGRIINDGSEVEMRGMIGG